PGGDHVDLAIDRVLAQPHDRSLAELLVARSERQVDRLVAARIADERVSPASARAGVPGSRGGSRGGSGAAVPGGARGLFVGHRDVLLLGGPLTARPTIIGQRI